MSFARRWIATVAAAPVLAVAVGAGATEPPALLSATGLFPPGQPRAISRDNLPVSPQYPLWSDGATKERWIHLPAGTAIDASHADAWEFPVGTRLWKQFSFGGRPVETRLIERLPDGPDGPAWRYASYVWNADATDATLAPARGLPDAADVAFGLRHDIPGTTDCRACHEGRATPVLGFSLLQLSPDRDPGAPHAEPVPPGGVDLRVLSARGLLRGLPARFLARPPRIEATSATARAALGYLHANCGGCHNGEGPLAELGLALVQRGGDGFGPAAVVASTVGQPSRFQPPGRDGRALRIARGLADRSVLPLRMRSREPLSAMPPLGSKLVDEAAVALVERWISEGAAAGDARSTTKPAVSPSKESQP
jgi:hypothetical protein